MADDPSARSGKDLSIIVASRNDDHGGGLLRRMQLFVDALADQAGRHRLNAELIVVEWNPPRDRPPLREALRWPVSTLDIRVITVPYAIHKEYKYAAELPLFQMIAKNVGIRRARGNFVLATNIDILFSEELVSLLASGVLRQGSHYRVDRYDVPGSVPEGPILEQLNFCRDNVIRVSKRTGTERAGVKEDVFIPGRLVPSRLNRFIMNFTSSRVRTAFPLAVRTWWRRSLRKPGMVDIHTNACGDFTLMSKKDWFMLRGYSEAEMFSVHIDSLFLYVAHFAGIGEQFLPDPMRIYHIEHSHGWLSEVDPSPRLTEDAMDRVRVETPLVPYLSFEQIKKWVSQMDKQKSPMIFNDEGWGIVNQAFPEEQVSVGHT
ncbi:MAG: hypothetical protein ABIS18_00715 [Actinomycetota bacterium]